MKSSPRDILVIDLGQLGDVVLSIPALRAIAERFSHAQRTVLVGAACEEVVRLTDLFDDVIVVNRRELRRMNKLRAVGKLVNLTREIRRRRFDLVIDIHSLPETNVLAFLSGAPSRLLADRESRSIDLLSNFRPKPPVEDKTIHISDYYLNVLRPLGIAVDEPRIGLLPRREDVDLVRQKLAVDGDRPLIGISPGAGHESRRWSLAGFAEIGARFSGQDCDVLVFLGPEEASRPEFARAFAPPVRVVSGLTIPQLVAAFSLLSVFVGNDSGPAHIAAAAGVPVVLLQHRLSPPRFLPLAERMRIVQKDSIDEITVDEAAEAINEMLSGEG